MTRNDLTTATLPALRAFLKAEDAYTGHSRDNAADLRAHALAVFDAKAEAEPEAAPEPEAKPAKAKRSAEARKAAAIAKKDELLQAAIEAAMKRTRGAAENPEDGAVTLHPEDLEAAGYSRAFWTNRAPWSPKHSAGAGAAAARAGFRALTRAINLTDLFTVVLVPSADPYARPSRINSTSRAKARECKVSAKTVGKMLALIAVATADADGAVVLTAEQLALGGIGTSWARITAAHLDDASHVKARTLAACGYIGRCSNGTLVLLPIDADEEAAA